MNEILNTIREDTVTLLLLIAILAVLQILNILLAAIMAAAADQFDWQKFWKGLLKALLIAICMVVFCLVLEILPTVLARAKLTVPEDMITVIQIFAIIAVSAIKYIKDIYAKFKDLLGVEESDETLEEGRG